ncbi:TetR/AcrR family transcriptional regulator [Kribbella sp. NPDC051586]|uniref:TetR/AcrR family transcriptional regulator n=1 Tax=Kribbella sp. NPDC051586 TaxID=3364118 RepID=UPI0037984CAF
MPKVSDRYRDARREHILNAARRAFLRHGFHATSMNDLFAEAKLSSGAVYRYFPGKEDIVLAIAEDNMREVAQLIRTVTEERPGESIGTVLAAAVELITLKNQDTGLAGIGVQAWSESLSNPRIGMAFGQMLSTLRTELAEVISRHQRTAALPADPSAEALAGVMIGVLVGHLLQLALLGPEAVADTPTALKALWPPSDH